MYLFFNYHACTRSVDSEKLNSLITYIFTIFAWKEAIYNQLRANILRNLNFQFTIVELEYRLFNLNKEVRLVKMK